LHQVGTSSLLTILNLCNECHFFVHTASARIPYLS